MVTTLDEAIELDNKDEILQTSLREFYLPSGKVYFDGNSLGLLSVSVESAVEGVMKQWKEKAIESWDEWIGMPLAAGDVLGKHLLGAAPGQTIVCDNVTSNLGKVLDSLVDTGDFNTMVVDPLNFPTDRYMAERIATRRLGGRINSIPVIDSSVGLTAEDVMGLIDRSDHGFILGLSHIDYKFGRRLPMREITEAARRKGGIVVWDLCHSVGAKELSLDRDADIAVGCTYKYGNSGPGGTGFIYINNRLSALPGVASWFAQEVSDQFDYDDQLVSAPDARKWISGTPDIMGVARVKAAAEFLGRLNMKRVGLRNADLTQLFIDASNETLAPRGFRVITPKHFVDRGAHVSLTHPEGYRLSKTLRAAGYVPDFRRPDVLRSGIAPYNSRQDILSMIDHLAEAVDKKSYEVFERDMKGVP